MTAPQRPFDAKQWDCIVDLLAAEQSQLSQADVKQELKRLGIDVGPTVSKVAVAIEQHKARAALARARVERGAVFARVRAKLDVSIQAGRDELVRLVKEKLQGPLQAAMFSRLDDAATDADLRSLLGELAALEEMKSEGEPTDGK